jgi:hypothetical protein
MREAMEHAEKYEAALAAANGLTRQELEGLRRNELPLFVIERVEAALRERRRMFFQVMGIWFPILVVISVLPKRGGSSEQAAVAWVVSIAILVLLAAILAVSQARYRARLGAPIIDWAQGELEKTRDKYRPYLMRVPGSPTLVFTAEQYGACAEGQPHSLAWLRGTDQGVAVFYARPQRLARELGAPQSSGDATLGRNG